MKSKALKWLDIVPLICLLISAINLLNSFIFENIVLQYRHIAGLIILPITTIAFFFVNRKIGVLAIGITIILGLVGLISFSPEIETITFGKTFGESKITLIVFQPIFVLWAVIHFSISRKYYFGVLSKEYWDNIKLKK